MNTNGIVVLVIITISGIIVLRMVLDHLRPRQAKTTEEKAAADDHLRGALGRMLTAWALIAVTVIALAILVPLGWIVAQEKDVEKTREFMGMGKDVLAMLLPVVGAWVGTVLAFYFGKESFKAGTDFAERLTSKEKLGKMKVDEIGKAVTDVEPLRLGPGDSMDTITLDKLEGLISKTEPPFQRFPILHADESPLMVVHRSVFNDFMLKMLKKDATKTAKDFKLTDLAEANPWLKEKSFAVAPVGASAVEAKVAMERAQGCADVFVTTDGTVKGKAVRWITNVDLLKAGEV